MKKAKFYKKIAKKLINISKIILGTPLNAIEVIINHEILIKDDKIIKII